MQEIDESYIRQLLEEIKATKNMDTDCENPNEKVQRQKRYADAVKNIKRVEEQTSTTKHLIHRLINIGFYKSPVVHKKVDLSLKTVAKSDDLKYSWETLQISWRGIGLTNKTNFKYISNFNSQMHIFSDEGCLKEIEKRLNSEDQKKLAILSKALTDYKNKTNKSMLSVNVTIPEYLIDYYNVEKTMIRRHSSGLFEGVLSIPSDGMSFKLSAIKVGEHEESQYSSKYLNVVDADILHRGWESTDDSLEKIVCAHYYQNEQEVLISKLNELATIKENEIEYVKKIVSDLFEHKLTLQRMMGANEYIFD